ncbi:hypothetical protein G6O67_007451 [Ophiocordyceps sinensis]|uniref:FHA domain-containing protein n=2 Tax=Ophiocordyceps sinensis TaxID=72228 RepID=A0A8H4PM17_9HYPO|nr:CAMK family protein kinase [Ophiocordyceps sinensis CO18]KAF4505509.1 hypothetical protein G6O67_007451 [Ophiocordyceps sinensis]
MEDTDLIARVYPVLSDIDIDSSALEAIQASPLYVAPPPLPTEPDHSDIWGLHYMPCIEFRFSNIPRSPHGIIFGRNPKSDVVIPSKSVSNYHFGLTFDDERHLIVKDLDSRQGTQVTYDGEGKGQRRGFCWIVGGDPILQDTTSIVITIDETTMFRIVAVHHDIESQAYMENVDRFCQGLATAEHLP